MNKAVIMLQIACKSIFHNKFIACFVEPGITNIFFDYFIGQFSKGRTKINNRRLFGMNQNGEIRLEHSQGFNGFNDCFDGIIKRLFCIHNSTSIILNTFHDLFVSIGWTWS